MDAFVGDLHSLCMCLGRKLGRALLERLQWRTHLVCCLLQTAAYTDLLFPSLPPRTWHRGRRAGSQPGGLSSWDMATPSTSSPPLQMSWASPYLFPPMPTAASAPGGRQRADPRVPGLLETLRPGWGRPNALQHHGAKLYLPTAFRSPGGDP